MDFFDVIDFFEDDLSRVDFLLTLKHIYHHHISNQDY